MASFNANGGSDVQSITAEVTFEEEYEIIRQNNGSFSVPTKTYTFGKENGTTDNADMIKLQYSQKAIKLPKVTKAGSGFIGWYTDASLTNYAGTEGDSYELTGDTTFYAKYSTIEINATDIYYKANNETSAYNNIGRDKEGKISNTYSTPDSILYIVSFIIGIVKNLSVYLLHIYLKKTSMV